jgi:branched-chain amino acid transport system substrate-binding protein
MTRITRRKFVQVCGGAALGAGMLGAAGSLPARAQGAKTITLGGSIPLSGKEADTGLNVYGGYKTAIKYLNEQLGGVKIGSETYQLELNMFDDASNPQRATTLLQKQLDEGIDFFLGSFSSAIVLPTAAITERARKPMVQAGGGSDQIFTRGFRYVFGMYPRASRQLVSTVTMLKSLNPAVKTVSIITTNDPYSRTQAEGVSKALKEAGITVLETYRLPPNVTDVSGVLNSIRGNPPDALICNTHERDSLLISQQLVTTGTNVKLLYQALGPQLESFRKTLGKYADQLTFLQYWDPRMKFADEYFGDSQKYYDYYKSIGNRPYTYQAVAGSACILCYVKAMQLAGTLDTAKVRDALASLDFSTVYGRIRFTPQGDGDPVIMGPKVGQVQNGKPEIVFPADAATASLQYPMKSWSERS